MCRTAMLGGLVAFQAAVTAVHAEESVSTSRRRPASEAELRYWIENMVWYHHFTPEEVQAATGLGHEEVVAAMRNLRGTRPRRAADAPLMVMPYPGGRHPRIGFLEGAIDPQRETKVSVFLPWDEASYVVVDVPEAIRSNLGLTYLAHTHVPTLWTRQNVTLPPLEWDRRADGSLDIERTLPNGIRFGAKIQPGREAVRMRLWLANGTTKTLTDLRVQNCVMLKAARGFEQQTTDNKVFLPPYAAVRSDRGDRWIITAWEPHHRTWANPRCPCLHSDPKFPDCSPGETREVHGWLSFYQGTDIEAEIRRIDRSGWRNLE